jgi:SAM-dependent methyltransferase
VPEDHSVRRELYRRYVTTHVAPAERDHHFRGRRLFPVTKHLPDDTSARILDIGCGAGDLIATIRELGYRNAVGVDVSEEQVQLAHGLGRAYVEQGDLFEYLGRQNGAFGAIIAVDVLEHFDRIEVVQLLDAVHRALASNGRLIAQVPNGVSPFFGNYAFGDFTHETVFTARSMRQICFAAGFEVVGVHPVPPQAHGLVSALRVGLWKVFSSIIKLMLASETGKLRGNIVTQNIITTAVRAT